MTLTLDIKHSSIEWHYAEYHDYLNVMLSAIMLNVIMLNVIMLNVVMLYVVMLNVVRLNYVMLSVVAPPEVPNDSSLNYRKLALL